jgi:hypothetical protein
MNAIFLDIDGVLNDINSIETIYEVLGHKQFHLLANTIGETPFNHRSCARLKRLIEKTNSVVVLSSTWRMSKHSMKTVEEYIETKLYGKTPNLGLSYARGKEIQEYLDNHKEITNYVILDDDTDMLESQKSHFVNVDGKLGFSEEDFEKCMVILNEKDDNIISD